MLASIIFIALLSFSASSVIRREINDDDVDYVEGENVALNGQQIKNQNYSRHVEIASHLPGSVHAYHDGGYALHGHSYGHAYGNDNAHGHGHHGVGTVHYTHGVAGHGHGRGYHGDGHVVHHGSHAVVPAHHVHLGHTHVHGVDETIDEGSTYSTSVSHSKASDAKHKHVHNDFLHLSAHHHDHTNLHKNVHNIHDHVHDHHNHIKENHNHIHDKTHDHTVIHDHHAEDHAHEEHNFETHDASHTASSEHVDHGLSVTDGHGHVHGHGHGHKIVDHGLEQEVALEHHHVLGPGTHFTYHDAPDAHLHHGDHDINHAIHGRAHIVHHDNRHLGHDHGLGHDHYLAKLQVAEE